MEILIVDDSREIRNSFSKLLNSVEGIDGITEAESPLSALKIFENIKPDIVILDIYFPKGSGFDVLKELVGRQQKPVMMVLTNFPNDQLMQKSYALGADYFFDKSKSIMKLVELIKNYVRSNTIN